MAALPTKFISEPNTNAAITAPAWSTDGQRIAYLFDSGPRGQLWVANADGTGRVHIATPGFENHNPNWGVAVAPPEPEPTPTPEPPSAPVPTGRIAFISDRDGHNEIYTVNADGSAPTRVTTTDGQVATPSFAPLGDRILYSHSNGTRWNITSIRPDGSDPTILTQDQNTSGLEAVFSPDGTRIAYVENPLSVMNANGTGAQILAPSGSYKSPAWSPDGNRIAFTELSFTTFTYQLRLINLANNQIQTLATGNLKVYSAAWSSNGQSLACVGNENGVPKLFLYSLDNGATTTLDISQVDSNYAPAWSPDGQFIVCVQQYFEPLLGRWNTGLSTIHVGSGVVTPLVRGSSSNTAPSWGIP